MSEVTKAEAKVPAKLENITSSKNKNETSQSISPVKQILFLQRTIGNHAGRKTPQFQPNMIRPR